MVKILNLNEIQAADRTDPVDLCRELDETRDLCRKLDEIIKNTPDGIYVTDGDFIQEKDLPINMPADLFLSQQDEQVPLRDKMEQIEYSFLLAAYEKHGNVRAAAASLGMPLSTYVRKRKEYEEKFGIRNQNI